MASMDYFRRPLLAGLNLARQTNATIRGSLRRTSPSGGVAFPYFSGVSAGQQITVVTQGGTHTATITNSSPSIASVIEDLNTATTTHATAFEADGVIAIRSSVPGAAGFVEVTGGTAAAALGFDTTDQEFRSIGGDIESGPEGRVGNLFGVAFPGRHENWDINSFNNAMGRMSANMDVLHSSLFQEEPSVEQVTATVGGDGVWIRPDVTTTRVFTGYGKLSRSSTKEDLAPFFHLIDTVTKQPATSRIVGCVRGTPAGIPVADSPNFADVTAKNVFGQNLEKTAATAITDVTHGRAVKVSGATFLTDGIQEGDIATIAGATNTSPWSNNGQRWIVEKIPSEEVLWLRPMSKSEMSMYGFSPAVGEVQPILELNSVKEDAASWGTVSVATGSWCSGVTFVLDPPLPDGASVELWAAVPKTAGSLHVAARRESLGMGVLAPVSDYDPAPAGFILAPYANDGGGLDLTVSAGTARWGGRVVSIPTTTVTLPDDSTSFVYWDEATATVKQSTVDADVFVWDNNDPSAPASSATRGHLIATVVTAAGAITTLENAARQQAEDVRVITVGHGGQFVNLESAAAYVNAWSSRFAETTALSGQYPHFDLVVVSDLTLSRTVEFSTPGIRVRGANPVLSLTLPAGNGFLLSGDGSYFLEDLQVNSGVTDTSVLFSVTGTARLHLRNVGRRAAAVALQRVAITSGAGDLLSLSIRSCDFLLSRSVLMGDGTDQSIVLTDSSFEMSDQAYGEEQILSPEAGPGTWLGTSFRASGCVFTNWTNGQGPTKPSFLLHSGAEVTFQNCRIAGGTFDFAGSGGSIHVIGCTSGVGLTVTDQDFLHVSGNSFTGPVVLTSCTDYVFAGNSVVYSVAGNAITLTDVSDGQVSSNRVDNANATGVGIYFYTALRVHCVGNNITAGAQAVVLTGPSDAARCERVTLLGNHFVTTTSIEATAVVDLIYASGNSVLNNWIKRTSGLPGSPIHIRISSASNDTYAPANMIGGNRLEGGTNYIVQNNNTGINSDDTFFQAAWATAGGAATPAAIGSTYAGGWMN